MGIFDKPKLRRGNKKKDTVPDDLWTKCPDCDRLLSVHALKYTHAKNCKGKAPPPSPEPRSSCSDAEARAFGASVGDWPAFPDSAGALAYLKEHYKLVILSNVDRGSFARSNAFSTLPTSPISPSIFNTASLAPPWAGPHSEAMPAAMQAKGLAPEDPAVRTVEVEAFCS